MKKLKKSTKEYLELRNEKIIEYRKKRKLRKKTKAKAIDIISSSVNKPKFKNVKVPKHLCLDYENTENVINFIKEVKGYAFQGYSIDFKLNEVVEITESAISMLLSVISDIEKYNVQIKGNKPDDENARDILERSGFFSHMHGYVSDKNMKSKNKILKTGKIDTHQRELIPEIHKAMDTVWGCEGRCPSLYGGIAEMMRNTCDHAFTRRKDIKWHLGICHEDKINTVKFTFVDNGKGIINTYTQKGLLKKIAHFFSDHAEILETAFKDGIESKTGLSWRGKGLPTIFEMYTDNIVRNLIIISNDVYIDFDKKISYVMKNDFSGTFYYWVIDRKCKKECF